MTQDEVDIINFKKLQRLIVDIRNERATNKVHPKEKVDISLTCHKEQYPYIKKEFEPLIKAMAKVEKIEYIFYD